MHACLHPAQAPPLCYLISRRTSPAPKRPHPSPAGSDPILTPGPHRYRCSVQTGLLERAPPPLPFSPNYPPSPHPGSTSIPVYCSNRLMISVLTRMMTMGRRMRRMRWLGGPSQGTRVRRKRRWLVC